MGEHGTLNCSPTQLLSPAGTNRANAADDLGTVDQMRQQLLIRMQQAPAGSVPQEAVACLEACHSYLFLSALVKGEAPPNLLPPTPPSYIMSRIRELAGVEGWGRGRLHAAVLQPRVRQVAPWLLRGSWVVATTKSEARVDQWNRRPC